MAAEESVPAKTACAKSGEWGEDGGRDTGGVAAFAIDEVHCSGSGAPGVYCLHSGQQSC